MIRTQRHSMITQMLAERGSVQIDELVEELSISPATARRDLDALAAEKKLVRTHGGATAAGTAALVDQPHRVTSNADEKRQIAQRCLQFIQPGAVIGLSGGSTVFMVAQELVRWAERRAPEGASGPLPVLTIVTNAVDIAYTLGGRPQLRVVLVGGVMNPSSYELTGPFSTHVMQQIGLDLAFIGVNGFDDNGPGTVDEFEAFTNRAMAARAALPIVVADSSKFGKRSFSSVGGPEVMRTIVTDDGLEPSLRVDLEEKGYQVVTVSTTEREMN